jgi:flagellar biosynthesis/type III secretory pathway protein FliH
MEEQYEAIDKIINKVLEANLATATGHVVTLLRDVTKEALNEGHQAGYELGYDAGYSIGYCEGAGVTDLTKLNN